MLVDLTKYAFFRRASLLGNSSRMMNRRSSLGIVQMEPSLMALVSFVEGIL